MADTERTRAALATLYADNTAGDISAQDLRDFLVSVNTTMGPAVAVTGTTTATVGQLHVCTGTSADYTVTLPAVSGNDGRYIAFKMGSGLTRFVTLDGNAAEQIDGAATRVMWANEFALLRCNGTQWEKMPGLSRPLACKVKRTASITNIATATVTIVDCAVTVFDNSTRMADNGNGNLVIRRAGLYAVRASVQFDSLGSTLSSGCSARKNGSTLAANTLCEVAIGTASGSFMTVSCDTVADLALSDTVDLGVYQDSGADGALFLGNNNVFVEATEVPSW